MEILSVTPVQTRIFHRGENLSQFVIESVAKDLIKEKMVLAVTSKIVSLAENRLISHAELKEARLNKGTLVERESDVFLGEVGYGCFLTIKEGLFIPSAGIDESNSENGDYILYPKDPFASSQKLWLDLKKAWGLKNLAIVMTDSHTTPLRKGVTGISLAHWGFKALREMVGSEDLFGRKLMMTNMNLADGLAGTAVMLMGEGKESQPLAVLSGLSLDFTSTSSAMEVRMPLKEDLYYPFFKNLIVQK